MQRADGEHQRDEKRDRDGTAPLHRPARLRVRHGFRALGGCAGPLLRLFLALTLLALAFALLLARVLGDRGLVAAHIVKIEVVLAHPDVVAACRGSRSRLARLALALLGLAAA